MAIAFVNSTDTTQSPASITITSSALSTTTGNFIVAVVNTYDSTTNEAIVTGITDTAGNTYVRAIGAYRSGTTEERSEIWYAENITGNAVNVLVATFTGICSDSYIAVAQFSGVSTTSALIDSSSAVSSATTSHSSGNSTSTASGQLMIGGYNAINTKDLTFGQTGLSSDTTAVFYGAEYSILGAAGDYAATLTTSAAETSIMVNAIFGVASGGGGTSGSLVNIGDSWKAIAGIQVNVGDVWKSIAAMKVNIGDSWKVITI